MLQSSQHDHSLYDRLVRRQGKVDRRLSPSKLKHELLTLVVIQSGAIVSSLLDLLGSLVCSFLDALHSDCKYCQQTAERFLKYTHLFGLPGQTRS